MVEILNVFRLSRPNGSQKQFSFDGDLSFSSQDIVVYSYIFVKGIVLFDDVDGVFHLILKVRQVFVLIYNAG